MNKIKKLGLVGLLGVGAVFGGCKGMSDDEVAAFGFIGDLAGVSPASSAAEAATGFAVGRAADRESGRREAREGKTEVNVYGGEEQGNERRNFEFNPEEIYLACFIWTDHNGDEKAQDDEVREPIIGQSEIYATIGGNSYLLISLGSRDKKTPVTHTLLDNGNIIKKTTDILYSDDDMVGGYAIRGIPLKSKRETKPENSDFMDELYFTSIGKTEHPYDILAEQGSRSTSMRIYVTNID